MRKLAITLFSFIISLSLIGCQQKTDQTNSTGAIAQEGNLSIYQVSDFTFKAPSEWSYTKAGDEFLSFETGYVLYEWDSDLNESNADDEFIDNFLYLTTLSYNDFKFISGPDRGIFSDCNGFSYEFQYTSEGENAQGKSVILFVNSGMLTFTLCDLDTTQPHGAEFDALIASLTRK